MCSWLGSYAYAYVCSLWQQQQRQRQQQQQQQQQPSTSSAAGFFSSSPVPGSSSGINSNSNSSSKRRAGNVGHNACGVCGEDISEQSQVRRVWFLLGGNGFSCCRCAKTIGGQGGERGGISPFPRTAKKVIPHPRQMAYVELSPPYSDRKIW